MPVIRVNKLSKTFNSFQRRPGILGAMKDLVHREYKPVNAVNEISFSVEPGELLGYIGPNGAGKSTSIKMLTGILKPTSGEMDVLGFHPFYQRKAYTKNIGVVFGQRTQLWWDIAVQESFTLLGRIYEVPDALYRERLNRLDKIFDVKSLFATPVRKLSLGQRMRCDLAAALIHDPKVLFLDEPTIGLDAVAKDSMRTFLRQINREIGTTIILTTHDLKEIEELCKRILILDQGKIIYDGSLSAVKALPGLARDIIIDFSGEVPLKALAELFGNKLKLEVQGERRLVATYDPHELPTVDLVKNVIGTYDVTDLTISEPGIEQVVMKIYREGLE